MIERKELSSDVCARIDRMYLPICYQLDAWKHDARPNTPRRGRYPHDFVEAIRNYAKEMQKALLSLGFDVGEGKYSDTDCYLYVRVPNPYPYAESYTWIGIYPLNYHPFGQTLRCLVYTPKTNSYEDLRGNISKLVSRLYDLYESVLIQRLCETCKHYRMGSGCYLDMPFALGCSQYDLNQSIMLEHQCGACHYSDGDAKYCGLGLERVYPCNHKKDIEQHS